MAASRFLGALGKLGVGIAVVGGVVQSALYNGKVLDVSSCVTYWGEGSVTQGQPMPHPDKSDA